MVFADFSFLEIMWAMLVFFAWVVWLMLLITVFMDVFRRHDMSGWKKVFWLLLVVVIPFIGVFIYLIVYSQDMAERKYKEMSKTQAEFDDYVRSVSQEGSASDQIAKAKELLESGAISQDEFETLKAKALAG